MDDLPSETLYRATISSENFGFTKVRNKKKICCCISETWCFKHSGIPGFKEYDENKNNCCTYLDCCTWCLEFNLSKKITCFKETNCYLCCCAIYFT
jgi:hypothetical protein